MHLAQEKHNLTLFWKCEKTPSSSVKSAHYQKGKYLHRARKYLNEFAICVYSFAIFNTYRRAGLCLWILKSHWWKMLQGNYSGIEKHMALFLITILIIRQLKDEVVSVPRVSCLSHGIIDNFMMKYRSILVFHSWFPPNIKSLLFTFSIFIS